MKIENKEYKVVRIPEGRKIKLTGNGIVLENNRGNLEIDGYHVTKVLFNGIEYIDGEVKNEEVEYPYDLWIALDNDRVTLLFASGDKGVYQYDLSKEKERCWIPLEEGFEIAGFKIRA